MCESAKDIQSFWSFNDGDYIFDPSDSEVMVWFGLPPEIYLEVVWLPRQDQLQEICIEFYIRNLGISRSEAFFHFLNWYTTCLKETYEQGFNIGKNGEYEEINSCEELMLKYIMELMYWKRWNGEKWVK